MIKAATSLKFRFSRDEDLKIQELVLQYGKKWTLISHEMKTRTARQIRERYLNYLDPNIKQGNWTEEEDQKLIFFISQNDKISWKHISTHFPGQTDVSIKNRTWTLNSLKNFYQNSLEVRNSSLPIALNYTNLAEKDASQKINEEKVEENLLDQFFDENLFAFNFLNSDNPPRKETQKNSFF
jgi:hypothetical protein